MTQTIETVKKDCKHEDCRYRTTFNGQPICGYMIITGNSRGTDISTCDKYKTGKVRVVTTEKGFRYYDV